jgi:hypothetical protein
MSNKVRINETGEIKTLQMFDRNHESGMYEDCTRDYISDSDAFNDGQFELDGDKGVYNCDAEIYDWWKEVMAGQESVNERVYKLIQKHGESDVMDIIYNTFTKNIEDYAAACHKAFNEAFGKETEENVYV